MRNARCDFVSWCGCQWWPIMLSLLATYLKSRGYLVKLIDAQAWEWDERKTGYEIGKLSPDKIIIYPGLESYETDLAFRNKLQMMGIPTAMYGYFAQLKDHNAFTIPSINAEYNAVQWIENKSYDTTNAINIFDNLPYMSEFMHFELQPEAKAYAAPSEPYPFIDVLFSKGCRYGKCAYCIWPKLHPHYFEMSAQRAVDEMEYIESLDHYKSIMIQDDTLLETRALSLSLEILKRNLNIKWSCYVRPNISYETLTMMKRAGCLNLHVGYESGNSVTLCNIRKGVTISQMADFTYDAKKAGLNIHGDFMIGIDATVPEIKNTIKFACKLNPSTVQFQAFIPYDSDTKQTVSVHNIKHLQRFAYCKFYSNPFKWSQIIKQFMKPRIFKESVKSCLLKSRSL